MKGLTKRLLALAVCLVFVLTVSAACGQQAATTAAAPAKEEAPKADASKADAPKAETAPAAAPAAGGIRGSADELYVQVNFVTGVEYWIPVYEMFKQCGRQLGVKTQYTGTPEYDVNKEMAVYEQVVAKKPKGIFLCPMNPDAFVDPINKAIDAGIAVTTFATDAPKSKRPVFITSDNVHEGNVAADAMAQALNEKGEVATLENPGQLNHEIRTSTFKKRMGTDHKDIKVVASAPTLQDPNKAYQAVMTIRQAHPNLGGVFMPEANSAMGAAQAAKELGGKILILTCDVNAKILDMIKAGDVWGALNPNQGMQGYFGMLTLFIAAHPELVDPMTDYKAKKMNPVSLPYIDNDLTIVHKDTADFYYLDKYLKGRNSKGVEE